MEADSVWQRDGAVSRRRTAWVLWPQHAGAGYDSLTHEMNERTHPTRTRERPDDAGTHRTRHPTKQRTDWRAEDEQWWRDGREEHVLNHVPGEKDRRRAVDRWAERRNDCPEPQEEDRGPPEGPRPSHPPHAHRVQDRGKDAEDDGD